MLYSRRTQSFALPVVIAKPSDGRGAAAESSARKSRRKPLKRFKTGSPRMSAPEGPVAAHPPPRGLRRP